MKMVTLAFAMISALVINDGGPSERTYGDNQKAHDVRSAISQERSHADTTAYDQQAKQMPVHRFQLASGYPVDPDCYDACSDALS